MRGRLERAFGYRGDTMTLPVPDLVAALPFYETVFGFGLVSRSDAPNRSAVISRDAVRIGLVENGGDPSQDGCAFHVTGLDTLYQEFLANKPAKPLSGISVESRDGVPWRVFYVVAPDGLCYWFGERETR